MNDALNVLVYYNLNLDSLQIKMVIHQSHLACLKGNYNMVDKFIKLGDQ